MRFSLRCLLRTIAMVLALVLMVRVMHLFTISTGNDRSFANFYDYEQLKDQAQNAQNQQKGDQRIAPLVLDLPTLQQIDLGTRQEVLLPLERLQDDVLFRLRHSLYTTAEQKRRRHIVSTINALQHVYNLERLAGNTSSLTSVLTAADRQADEQAVSTDQNSTHGANRNRTVPESSVYPVNFVIIVQTHNRTEYLRELISSLKKVVGIERSLLIISHDFYSAELDELVRTVDFCPLMQIFFPFSRSWYAKEFPGEHPLDCARDAPLNKAKQSGCNNADWPDSYGHYRESKFTQTKQHYIWKLAHTFDGLKFLRSFNGPLILLEDDHYVSPDLLHFATLSNAFRVADLARRQAGVAIVSLGHYDRVNYNEPHLILRTYFESTKNNMGMMVDRAFWQSFKSCSKVFCQYDDYNWDWSLQYLSIVGCITGKLAVYAARVPRVYHIGNCGVHHRHQEACDVRADADNMRKQLEPHHSEMLGVTGLQLAGDLRPLSYSRPVGRSNGGWGDRRDHELCKASASGVHAYLASVANDSSPAVKTVRSLLLASLLSSSNNASDAASRS